jgi:lipid-A-disaccharide synthase
MILTEPADIVILSNGPGEITTWVRPVVQTLRQQWGNQRDLLRISLLLSPCPHAMGNEAVVAGRYDEIDRIQESQYFFRFLLSGHTATPWDWRAQGVVLFLGGDQFYALAVGKRLGYRTVVYAEWEARWTAWIDAFGVMQQSVLDKMPPAHRGKGKVVGDLMADVGAEEPIPTLAGDIIGLFPGSKPHKLVLGVPLALAIAHWLYELHPTVTLKLFLAPTVDLATLARYGDRQQNPMMAQLEAPTATLMPEPQPYWQLQGGARIEIITQFPAQTLMKRLSAAVTTVGANTAQLGALGIPMLVLLPTQNLGAMKLWDGVPGLLTRLPGVGTVIARIINSLILRQGKLYAWPNIWAGEAIVPEWVGEIEPQAVARQLNAWLEEPETLQAIGDRLRASRGQSGAALALANLVMVTLTTSP